MQKGVRRFPFLTAGRHFSALPTFYPGSASWALLKISEMKQGWKKKTVLTETKKNAMA